MGMDIRIAINLRGGSLKNPGSDPLCEAQTVDRAHDRRLGGLNGIILIMRRRSRTGQVVNLVHFHTKGFSHIVPDQLKFGIAEEMGNVLLATGKEVVET